MGLRWGAVDETTLRARLPSLAAAALTYEPVGMSLDGAAPAGYRRGTWSTSLGWGPNVFDRSVEALQGWQVHRGAGLRLATDGPLSVGINVAMSVPLPFAALDAGCRVVVMVEEPDRFGFAYGTLPGHPERGEESFLVTRQPNGYVDFTVVAVSALSLPLARLVPPAARLLQSHYTRRYLAALRRAVGTDSVN